MTSCTQVMTLSQTKCKTLMTFCNVRDCLVRSFDNKTDQYHISSYDMRSCDYLTSLDHMHDEVALSYMFEVTPR